MIYNIIYGHYPLFIVYLYVLGSLADNCYPNFNYIVFL